MNPLRWLRHRVRADAEEDGDTAPPPAPPNEPDVQAKDNRLGSDRPGLDPEGDDKLGYAPFAKHLAESLAAMAPTEGIVVALYGPWGSGKTTLLNFVTHYLGSVEESKRPIVVRFNPWWFSGDEGLTRRFFDELRLTLSEKFAPPPAATIPDEKSCGGGMLGAVRGAGGRVFAWCIEPAEQFGRGVARHHHLLPPDGLLAHAASTDTRVRSLAMPTPRARRIAGG